MQLLPSLLVVLGAAFVVVHCELPKPKHWDACAKEHNGPSDFKRPDYSKEASEVPENRKCFERCLMVKEGFMTEAGDLDWKKVEETYPRSKAIKPLAEKCVADSKYDHKSCDHVYATVKCVADKIGAMMKGKED